MELALSESHQVLESHWEAAHTVLGSQLKPLYHVLSEVKVTQVKVTQVKA